MGVAQLIYRYTTTMTCFLLFFFFTTRDEADPLVLIPRAEAVDVAPATTVLRRGADKGVAVAPMRS